MAMLENLRLSTRINLQQGLVVLGLIGLSAFSLYSMRGIDHEMITVTDEVLPLIGDITHVTEEQQRQNYLLEKALRYSGVEITVNRKQAFEQVVREFGETEEKIVAEIEKTKSGIRSALGKDNSKALQEELETLLEDVNELSVSH